MESTGPSVLGSTVSKMLSGTFPFLSYPMWYYHFFIAVREYLRENNLIEEELSSGLSHG